ncbi:hypothetical protein M422DRAFT_150938 [Sphaerobolus stellatus SS14]|nr:hypothetical protein M422DRAFT_150938 [Sphaerobolus stellatus SS14]
MLQEAAQEVRQTLPTSTSQSSAPTCQPARRSVVIEELPDEELYTEPYPGLAGVPIGIGETKFDTLRRLHREGKTAEYGPFKNKEEWELGRWLMTSGISQRAIDEYLKLDITRNKTQPSYQDKRNFLEKIDLLPGGAGWTCYSFAIRGDILDYNGECITEELDIWYRNPVECIPELMGNPIFHKVMKYAPERLYADKERAEQIYNEMWTADWWWELQGKLPPGATIAPVILASDKTQLSVFSGDKQAWPVYISIGNIGKATRRQTSQRAMILLGYIPVTKLDCLSPRPRQGGAYRLFHYCMSVVLKPLVEAAINGVDIVCADNKIRRVYPILAAYIADFPEQCLVAAVKECDCPICEIDPAFRGEPFKADIRNPETVLEILYPWGTEEERQEFIQLGLCPIPEPFWAKLPHANIFTCFTPDLLHQLHKGVFKDHLVKWCIKVAEGGAAEIDRRFKCMPKHLALRHFHKGISTISQWTGREYKEMERVFAGLIWGAVPADVAAVARAIIDFIYYASFTSHSTETLWRLQDALDTFHKYKKVFVTSNIREHFRIPKIHMMEHYVSLIRLKGTTDGYNTEQSERLHIDCAKDGYRASNKKEYTQQMVTYLTRQEYIHSFTTYLEWREGISSEVWEVNEDQEVVADPESLAPQLKALQLSDKETESITSQYGLTWHITKKPSSPNTAVETLITDYGAVDIIPELTKYLDDNVPECRITPTQYDQYDVYNKIIAEIPAVQQLTNERLRDVIRVSPGVPSKGRKKAEPAHFDCVLVHARPDAEDVGLHGKCCATGYRAARIRAIFCLPHYYRCKDLLAYVEWFTPFSKPVMPLRMSEVGYSMRNGRRVGAVIQVASIRRSCHLIPKFGKPSKHGEKRGNIPWSSENVMDKCTRFFFNSQLSLDMFQFCDGDYELVEE